MVKLERIDDLRELRKNQPGKTIISAVIIVNHFKEPHGGLYETDTNIYVGLGIPAVH